MTDPNGRAPRRRRPELPHDDVLLLMGQLLELVQGASESFRTSSGEITAQAVRVEKVTRALEALEAAVRELNRIVLTGDDKDPSLRHRVGTHAEEIKEFARALKDLSGQITAYDRRHNQAVGAGQTLLYLVIGTFQLATLGIAVYAAMRGN
jgi:hypothetical protein